MKTRTTKELLIILRDNLEEYIKKYLPNGGMCQTANFLYEDGVITLAERNHIYLYLNANKPCNAKIRYKKYTHSPDKNGFFNSLFWWELGAIPPRMGWLNKKINKL